MTTKEAIEILNVQIDSWNLFKQPPRFMEAMDTALNSLIDANKREQGCRCCSFEVYNLTRRERNSGYLRGRPIHVNGVGRDYQELYLLKRPYEKVLLVAETATSRIEKPIDFCPCCGKLFNEKE